MRGALSRRRPAPKGAYADKLVIAGVASLALLFSGHGTAVADVNETTITQFLDNLDAAGVDFGDPGVAIALGEKICTELRDGEPVPAVVNDGVRAGFAPSKARSMVGASASSFCPDQDDRVQDFLNAAG